MGRLRLEMGGNDGHATSAEEWLRRNVLELMQFYRMRQATLAEKIGRSQSWLSRRLSGKAPSDGGSRFQFEDLDRLAAVFGLSPAELLEPKYGEWDRRTGHERRSGTERRRRAPSPFLPKGTPLPNPEDEGVA